MLEKSNAFKSNVFKDGSRTRVTLIKSDYLTAEEIRWVMNTAPAIIVDNNYIEGTPGHRIYRDGSIHIGLDGSLPVISWQADGGWEKVFDQNDRRVRPQKGPWFKYLGELAVQFNYEKDAKGRHS